MLNWYRNASNATKAALNTVWQAFVASFGLSLIGWLRAVQEWADDSTMHEFPSVSPLGKAAAAATVAALGGLVTYLYRRVRPTAKTYEPKPGE